MMQTITSKNTSLNQLPAVAKLVAKRFGWTPGTRNLDLGSGKYDKLTGYLADEGVENLPYDPYNRSPEENDKALAATADTVVVSNVLNVINCRQTQKEVLQIAKSHLRPGGHLYVTIYEGNKSGEGKVSKEDCWQENRRAIDFLGDVESVFSEVKRHGNLIVAKVEEN